MRWQPVQSINISKSFSQVPLTKAVRCLSNHSFHFRISRTFSVAADVPIRRLRLSTLDCWLYISLKIALWVFLIELKRRIISWACISCHQETLLALSASGAAVKLFKARINLAKVIISYCFMHSRSLLKDVIMLILDSIFFISELVVPSRTSFTYPVNKVLREFMETSNLSKYIETCCFSRSHLFKYIW